MATAEPQAVIKPGGSRPVDPLRSLRLRALVALISGILSIVLLLGEWWMHRLHHASLALVFLLFFTFLAGFDAGLRGVWRVLRGPSRGRAALWLATGLLGCLFWMGIGWYGHRQWRDRNVPHNWPMTMVKLVAASLMEAQAKYLYPHRIETDRLVMFYGEGITDPQAEAEEMDRHLARMEALTGIELQAKIWWVRGTLLGQGRLSMRALALGSQESPVGKVDHHELAHALIYQGGGQGGGRDTHPPTLLSEGWAEAQSMESAVLAQWAERSRRYFHEDMLPSWEQIERENQQNIVPDPQGTARLFQKVRTERKIDSFLSELTDSFWYDHDAGPVYSIGGAFVDFLLRKFGPERFVELYFTVRPGTFAAECERIYGLEMDALELQFWKEVERLAKDPQIPDVIRIR